MSNEEDVRARRNQNLELWERLFPTDPSQTKTFRRAGGFSGTAIKPMWMVMRATEEFGPIGQGWGWSEIENKIYTMTNEQAVWFSKVMLWYRLSYLGLAGDVHMGLFDDSKY